MIVNSSGQLKVISSCTISNRDITTYDVTYISSTVVALTYALRVTSVFIFVCNMYK